MVSGLVRVATRRWRIALMVAAVLALANAAATEAARPELPVEARPIEIQARPIAHFQSAHPGLRQFGKLVFRGGLVLSSTDPSFGGLSGLAIEPDGRRMLAVSDEGTWITADITYRAGVPVGLSNARLAPLLALGGRRIVKKRDLDAEALALLEGGLTRGKVLIGFEHSHRIGVFPIVDGKLEAPTRYLRLPNDARSMRLNRGFEAVAALKGGPFKGSVVAFSERYPGPASRHVGWIWLKDTAHRMTLADHGGFDITDAVSLPNGSVVVLERRFRWTEGVKTRLRLLAADDIKPGAELDGETLLEADLTSAIDNMEGISAHRGPNGETVLTIISDNNFNSFLQRNLLLQFTLVDERAAASPLPR
jgi:hypothetical protein